MSQPLRPPNTQQSLFWLYLIRLSLRALLLVFAVYLFCTDPALLAMSDFFGKQQGFNLVDLVFIVMMFDILTKLSPRAFIALGSLKQFHEYHIPTGMSFRGGRERLNAFIRHQWEEEKGLSVSCVKGVEKNRVDLSEQTLHDIEFLKRLSFKKEDLTAEIPLRKEIKRKRYREVFPVLILWVASNALLYLFLLLSGLLSEQLLLLWSLVYLFGDLLCVVAWCPFQTIIMRNKCCTTCQIFNWDALMLTTPLIFLGGVFGWTLVGLSLIVLVRWELSFARHPERFNERTNASLHCINCSDRLCKVRAPLFPQAQTKMQQKDI